MKDSGSAPQSPDPNVVIPLQTAANKDMFNYALDASRVNQVSPYGTQGWTSTDNFDQAGYDKATADWTAKYGTSASSAGSPSTQPAISPQYFMQGGMNGDGGGDGYNSGYNPQATVQQPTSNNPAAPTKDQFTKKNWTYTQAFSPEQQKLYDQNVASQMQQGDLLKGLGQNVANSVSKPMDWSSLPELTGSLSGANLQNPTFGDINRGQMPGELSSLLQGLGAKMGGMDPSSFNSQASDAMYRQNTRYLDEQTNQQKQAMEARLAEQGFTPGTPGYDQAMRNFMDTNARAYADARDRSLTMGTQVGNQAFGNQLQGLQAQIAAALQGGNFDLSRQGQDFSQQNTLSNQRRQSGLDANAVAQQQFANNQSAATFGNQARNQAMAEMLQQRNQPLNELNAMRSGTQVTLPNNQAQYSTPNLQSPDIMGAYQQKYQNDLGAYNANVAGDNSGMGDMLGLLGAFGGAPSGSLFAGLGKKLLGG